MKKAALIVAFISFFSVNAQTNLDNYLSNYSYENRKEMKISSKQIVQLLKDDQALLVDIRFEEEQAA